MIKVVYGNIANASERVIAHGCNCQGLGFGDGINFEMGRKFPQAKSRYFKLCKYKNVRPGTVQVTECGDKLIVNMFIQWSYGRKGRRYVDYEMLEKCFVDLIDWMTRHELDDLAIPMIGTGYSGGDWDQICDVIQKANNDRVSITVYYEEEKRRYY